VVHVGGTDHPTDEWITQQVRDATPFEEKPKYLICDNDKRYGHLFEQVVQASGIEVIHTPYEAPRANAICERFIGSLRRECLDHMLVIGERQLTRVLKEYVSYFNPARPHQGIAQRIPAPTVSPPGVANSGKVMAFPMLNGLHHDYRWATT
jgi:putative transposase